MSKKAERMRRMFDALERMGIDYDTAVTLRRIELTLTSWGERETGGSQGCIQRDEKTDKPYNTWEGSDGKIHRVLIADREKGALKRLAKIMEAYPALVAHHQTDCRGVSLYIVQRSDIREGEKLDEVYTRGIAVSYG